jgi:hydroxymethylpyrimidine pyrophosphatase-like HAD family hydrolase
MAIQLIALDIDGTLLDSQGRIPAENMQAIADARARGIEIALVTGRRYDFAKTIADQIDLEFVMIVSNGALIRSKNGETHARRLLPREHARRVLEITAGYREGASVVFDRPREGQVIYESLIFTNTARQKYYEANRKFIAQISPLENCLTEDPIQVVFTGPVDTMRSIVPRLQANRGGRDAGAVYSESAPTRLPVGDSGAREVGPCFVPIEHGQRGGGREHLTEGHAIEGIDSAKGPNFEIAVTEYESRDFTIVDVLCAGCTKGRALEEWAGSRNIARSEIMAIGDNWNDREMLAFAGLPVVMGNASPALKLQAKTSVNSAPWRVTLSNDEGGVAVAIRKFALGE